jgi:NADPH:quinone reductase-like Zn-dependent oxidoreductase
MSWQHVRISRFGGPEVLELAEEPTVPSPGPSEVRIKVLAAGTGFTDSFIRRGRYPDFKGPLPFTPGYELVGVVEKAGSDVVSPREGQTVADLCVVGGYAQYAIRPARFLVAVPDGVDAAEAVCIPLAYLTAFQMLTRYRRLLPGETILVIGASGTVGTALLDLSRHFGLKAIGTSSAANLPTVERFGATAIDYRAGDFVARVRELTAGRVGGTGVVRLSRAGRHPHRLRLPDHGNRAGKHNRGGAGIGAVEAMGSVELPIRWPSCDLVQHYGPPLVAP